MDPLLTTHRGSYALYTNNPLPTYERSRQLHHWVLLSAGILGFAAGVMIGVVSPVSDLYSSLTTTQMARPSMAVWAEEPKDPAPPRRPRNPYIMYSSEVRPKVVKQLGEDAKVTAVMKRIGQMWTALSAEAKEPYVRMAAEDKQRYLEEMKTYTPPPAAEENAKEPKKSRRKVKSEKDPNAPKRPRSAYLLFGTDARVRLAKKGLPPTEIMRAIAEEWKDLAPRERSKYEALAAAEKKSYEAAMAAYKR